MTMHGDWSANWDIFRAEYEDYVLVTGLADKTSKVQAATLRSLMGSKCRHIYHHNLNLTAAQQGDVRAIVRNVPARLREKATTCDCGVLKVWNDLWHAEHYKWRHISDRLWESWWITLTLLVRPRVIHQDSQIRVRHVNTVLMCIQETEIIVQHTEKTCRLCVTDSHFAKVCLKSKSRPTEGKLYCIEVSKE